MNERTGKICNKIIIYTCNYGVTFNKFALCSRYVVVCMFMLKYGKKAHRHVLF